ncbi:hypothetical protein [Dactylosporangium sp. CA-233914]|uniref:hypothetical protein n=1 Tax=Dactylosporangium sp. CA-233914 TaxID=3239934 RepID=UPI003D947838
MLGDEQLVRLIAAAVREAEVSAAETAGATPGLDDVLAAVRASGRRGGIVSNNAVEAVEVYRRRRGLFDHVDLVVGRCDGMDLALLKLGRVRSGAVRR